MPLKQLNNEELAYIAGLFDGEGHVGFVKLRSGYFVRVIVVNTNKQVLEYLQECFGGDIKESRSRNGSWKRAWHWRLSWSKAIEFLDLIEPWLRIKEDQAHLAFCWNHHRPGMGRFNKEKREEIDSINEYIKECFHYFNKRGSEHIEDPIEREIQNAAN